MNVGAAVGKCRMTPKDVASTRVLDGGQQLRAAEFLVSLGIEPGEDQFTLIIPKPVTAVLFHDEHLAEQGFLSLGGGERFPLSIPSCQI